MPAKPKHSFRWLSLLLWIGAGCAPTQQVASVYENPLLADRAFAKILVVGAHPNVDRRRRFEDDVVRSFAEMNVGAVSVLTARGGDQTLNRDVVVAAARETASDAVLITRVLEVREGQPIASSARSNDQPLTEFFNEYAQGTDPMTVTSVRTVLVASNLYEVASEARVWSGQSTAFEKSSVDAAITDLASAVTRTLRAGGWLD
jgi:hypothetical protein